MPRPYSNDLRERVVAAVESGETCRAVAERFGVAVSSVVKWSQRYRRSGSVAPGRMGGYRPALLTAHRAFVQRCFADEPELTLRGLQRKLADIGIKASYGAIWSFVHAEGLSFKKNRAGQRAGQTRRGPPAAAMEDVSGTD